MPNPHTPERPIVLPNSANINTKNPCYLLGRQDIYLLIVLVRERAFHRGSYSLMKSMFPQFVLHLRLTKFPGGFDMDSDTLKEACDRIERSTLDGAYAVFGELLGELFDNALLEELQARHFKQTLCWQDLAMAWQAADSRCSPPSLRKYFQELAGIFASRVVNEQRARQMHLSDHEMKLYYHFENKSLREIVPYLNAHYEIYAGKVSPAFFSEDTFIRGMEFDKINLLPALKSEEYRTAENIQDIPLRIMEEEKILLKYLQATYITKLNTWDQLIDYCKILTSAHDDRANDLMSVLLCLQSLRADCKMPAPTRYFTPCTLCWRMALVSTAKKKSQARCHVHQYARIEGNPSRKRAYERALKVQKLLEFRRHERPGLVHAIGKHFTFGKIHALAYFGFLKWWRHDPRNLPRYPLETGKIPLSLWETVPHVRSFLQRESTDVESPVDVVQALMPLPAYADAKAAAEYEAWLALWGVDFRIFAPILAEAEYWLEIFAEQYPTLPIDV